MSDPICYLDSCIQAYLKESQEDEINNTSEIYDIDLKDCYNHKMVENDFTKIEDNDTNYSEENNSDICKKMNESILQYIKI